MSTALLIANDFTPEQIKLITDTVARGATKDELSLFLYRAKSLALDPLKPGQIYFIKYGSGPGTIVIGIDGFRARAERTGKLSGIKRGALRNDAGILIGAFAEVYRSDWKECAREEVPLAEYNTGKGNWQRMPETMIKKVAECAALRMAFPDDLGGLYSQEEMDQANRNPIHTDQPGPEDGIPDLTWRVKKPAKHHGKRLDQMTRQEMEDVLLKCEEKESKSGPLTDAAWIETRAMIREYLIEEDEAAINKMNT